MYSITSCPESFNRELTSLEIFTDFWGVAARVTFPKVAQVLNFNIWIFNGLYIVLVIASTL